MWVVEVQMKFSLFNFFQTKVPQLKKSYTYKALTTQMLRSIRFSISQE